MGYRNPWAALRLAAATIVQPFRLGNLSHPQAALRGKRRRMPGAGFLVNLEHELVARRAELRH